MKQPVYLDRFGYFARSLHSMAFHGKRREGKEISDRMYVCILAVSKGGKFNIYSDIKLHRTAYTAASHLEKPLTYALSALATRKGIPSIACKKNCFNSFTALLSYSSNLKFLVLHIMSTSITQVVMPRSVDETHVGTTIGCHVPNFSGGAFESVQ